MAVLDLYSKRKKREERAGVADVYKYDELPQPFRVQVAHIWRSAIGTYVVPGYVGSGRSPLSNKTWELIHDAIARESGVFELGRDTDDDISRRCVEHLMEASAEAALDIIEMSFGVIDAFSRRFSEYDRRESAMTQTADDAIAELNTRFREHSLGYQYQAGQIQRIDSEYVHAEAVKPALKLLSEAGFTGVQDEFLRAHEHYRHGRNKEAIADALKAFESTMKTICDKRGWRRDPNATAAALIRIVFDNNLVPVYLLNHFQSLQSLLSAGLPTLRNRVSGHGQGAEVVEAEGHLVAYALHLAASNIVFLVERHKALK